MRLLIADRDSTERTGIKWLITSQSIGFTEIRLSPDLTSLMSDMEEFKPDILLVELEMIPNSSWEVFLQRAEKNASVIVAMTTEAVFERAWQALQLQSSGLLIKPLSPEQIRLKMSLAVRNLRKKCASPMDVLTEKEILQYQYTSLFFEGNTNSTHTLGMMVIYPKNKNDIREIAEWLSNHYCAHSANILPLRDHIVCILPSYSNEMIYQESQRILREIATDTGTNVFIAISSTGDYSTSIHECYEQSLQAWKMIFFKGHQQIIDIKNVPAFLHIDPFLTTAEQRNWMAMLEEGDQLAIKRWLYEQFTEFPKGYPDPDLLRIRLTSILAHLRRFMQTYQLEKIKQMEIRYQEIFQTILHVPVLYRIVQEILLFIYDILQHVENQREYAYGDIIERGLRYIDEFYHHSDLCLEEVANFVQRSPSYFSHLLSLKRKQTFSQYLQQVRIKQAKHLLSSSTMTIREISFAV